MLCWFNTSLRFSHYIIFICYSYYLNEISLASLNSFCMFLPSDICAFALPLQEKDPIIAQGTWVVVASAHSEMPGKLSAESRAARWEKILDAVPERKPGAQKESGISQIVLGMNMGIDWNMDKMYVCLPMPVSVMIINKPIIHHKEN